MGDKTKDFFRLTWGKIFAASFFVSWQYFYSFRYDENFVIGLAGLGQYLTGGLTLISWNNYFVRTGSLFLIWIVVAFIIFICLWVFEKAATSIHNSRVMKEYINRPKHDYEHLLKSTKVKFSSHLLVNAIWVGGALMVLFSLFFVSDQLENLRFWAMDTLAWNAFEGGAEVNIEGIVPLAISFAAMLPFWYLVVCTNVWIFKEAKVEEEEEELIEEHFALIQEDNEIASTQEVQAEKEKLGATKEIQRNTEEKTENRERIQVKESATVQKTQSEPEKTIEKTIKPQLKTENKMGLLEKIRIRSALGPQYKEKIVTPENFKRIRKINPDEKVKIISNGEQRTQGDKIENSKDPNPNN